jgi:hypothetical protein
MTKETEARWAERVREWRASGLSAEEFASSRGYKASTLQWAASRLRSMAGPAAAASNVASSQLPSGTRVRRRRDATTTAPRFLPVRTRAAKVATGEMVVEIGAARIRVAHGFDGVLLGDIVRALGGAAR